MADTDGLSLTALIVALAALLIALAQLLQQIFGTAEGYRKCQKSVLGPWAKRTRLVWRWSQFRFEVEFTTANIVMSTVPAKQESIKRPTNPDRARRVIALDATGANRAEAKPETNLETDMVSWIKLMKNLEAQTWNSLRRIPTPEYLVSNPAMTLREWSWDLMPPEVSRPTATTTLGTLLLLGHRLGMTWQDVRPSEGFLRAEGNGQSINTTIVRGFGLLVQYSAEDVTFGRSLTIDASLRIPTAAADKMGFGIIPGCRPLDMLDLICILNTAKGVKEDFSAAASGLRFHDIPSEVVEDMINPRYRFGAMYDYMFMAMPFISPYGSAMAEVFNPLRINLDASYLRSSGFRFVLKARLDQYISQQDEPSKQLITLAEHLNEFATKYSYPFSNSVTFDTKAKYQTSDAIDYCHRVWDELTAWFKDLQDRGILGYSELVAEHLTCNVRSWREASSNIDNGRHRNNGSIVTGPRNASYVEVAHIYADKIEAVKDRMVKLGYDNEIMVIDAIWTLLIRAIYCGAPLIFLPEQTHSAVAADFWESRTPVYII